MSYIAGYTGWCPTVNRVILDSTTITLGENAIKSDELDSGGKRTRLKSDAPSEKYSVTMEFNWIKKDEKGKTELQRFYDWYQYDHRYGSVPFEFPQIIYSPTSGIKVIDDASNVYRSEYYKITSAVEGSKSGESVQIKMTWKTVYGGVVSYTEDSIESGDVLIYPHNGFIDIYFSTLPPVIPPTTSISLSIEKDGVPLEGFSTVQGSYFDNSNTLRIFYPLIDELGTYEAHIKMDIPVNEEILSIMKSASFEVKL